MENEEVLKLMIAVCEDFMKIRLAPELEEQKQKLDSMIESALVIAKKSALMQLPKFKEQDRVKIKDDPFHPEGIVMGLVGIYEIPVEEYWYKLTVKTNSSQYQFFKESQLILIEEKQGE